MALDISLLLDSAPQLLRDLPVISGVIQLVFYASLAMTFGSIVMRAYKGYLSWPARLGARAAFGFLALFCGIGISWLIPPISDVPMYRAIQELFINVVPGGIISTAVLFFSLSMISHNVFNIPGIDNRIKSLQELKTKATKVQEEEKKQKRQGIRHPVRLAGIAIFAGFLIFALSGFQGFPNPLSELGLDQEDLNRMADQVEDVNENYGDQIGDLMSGNIEECSGALSLGADALRNAEPAEDAGVRAMIEQATGEQVLAMYSVSAEDKAYFLTVTTTQTCLSTAYSLCICHETSALG